MKNRKTGIVILIIIVVLLVACGVGYVLAKNKEPENTGTVPADGQEDSSGESSNTITYNGQKYEFNHDLKTILFLGVDKNGSAAEVQGYPGYNGQTDTIILFVMNTKDKTTSMLEVSRDSMTDIRIYDISGEYVMTENAQITLQYAFGDGGKKSCQLTKDAVSHLLYDIPIRSYLGMTMEGIRKITDVLGGVTLTIPEDYTYIDPSYVAGSTVTLNGEQAEHYVRYRDTDVTGSNDQRMERQTQFLMAMASQLKEMSKLDQKIYSSLIGSANDYLITDLSGDELQALSDYEMTGEALKVPGETVQGAEHDEYHVNNEELQKLIIKVFYKPAN